jgi:hypothetical protein
MTPLFQVLSAAAVLRTNLLAFVILLCGARVASAQPASPPPAELAPLKVVARLPAGSNRESSGIVRSRKNPDQYWVHNDSGDEPRLYPIHRDGSPYLSKDQPDVPGVLIEGATHVDWEDVTTLADGTLVIADMGNNGNTRKDLAIYFVEEPAPTASRSATARRISVRYPDQNEFPPAKSNLNFDCEAIFSIGQTVYMLTKHRSGDLRTKLYRLDQPRKDETNTLTLLGDFDIGGMVVAADCDAAGKRLLILTLQQIWLFERDNLETPFLQGRVSSRPYFLPQAEAICFADDETALLTDEIADTLFEFKLRELRPVP